MQVDFIAVFLIGLLGGFSHCIGMCGGFVMTYTLQLRAGDSGGKSWGMIWPHVLYNSGRVLTYMILGEVFGLLGSTLKFVLAVRDLQGLLQLFAGIVMIVMGLDLSGILPKKDSSYFPGINRFKELVRDMFRRVNRGNIFGLGFVLGFIPCGLVYAAGAVAASTQSLFGGMLTMLAFGLGTFPAMLLVGFTTEIITQRWRARLYKTASWLVILMGVLTILRGVDALGWVHIYWLV